MTLAFSTQLNGKPTYFVEKIWKCLFYSNQLNFDKEYPIYKQNYINNFGKTFAFLYNFVGPKRHSIRSDKSNRWKAGNLIHFVINNRTPIRFQFAPVIKCISTQAIEIVYVDSDGCKLTAPTVYIDGVWITDVESLAINDGFENLEEFFAYFNTNYTGKIIHWTNYKY